jgi:hypothetical protein
MLSSASQTTQTATHTQGYHHRLNHLASPNFAFSPVRPTFKRDVDQYSNTPVAPRTKAHLVFTMANRGYDVVVDVDQEVTMFHLLTA